MKKYLFSAVFLWCLFAAAALSAQQKHALLIGNNNYPASIGPLLNPVADVTAVAEKLRGLGYRVDFKTNLNLQQMSEAVEQYRRNLSASEANEGFFWYAGHGVQIDGQNYLVPLNADPASRSSLRFSSYSADRLLATLEEAGNRVNVVILDACRNAPQLAATRGSRGLAVISSTPPDMIVMYSTAAGQVAQDGDKGRRSPFTEAFLKNIDKPEPLTLVLQDISSDTYRLSGNTQSPWLAGTFRSNPRYSLKPPAAAAAAPAQTAPAPRPAVVRPAAAPERPAPEDLVRVPGGTFTMGSPPSEPGGDDDKVQHQVTVSAFYMGKYEVTQKEYQALMGNNPSEFKGDTLPVERVSWFDAVKYCNARSLKEGLDPAYTINGETVAWNRNAGGYRLPTEAEWEYACRAGTTAPFYTGNSADAAGWYKDNSGGKTHPAGQKQPNRWGLYDMHGNVHEWCWDWFGAYSGAAQTDPAGAASGSYRVLRGGSWGSGAQYLRSANRGDYTPSNRLNNSGFRLVRP
ncbi:MAG: SUMF1/EgtB/PvdO family nonheme iron enzyme [Treponema sp.]|jgi:formylglycine-generating enzyme required for sulfatase activity|nr:SUMF1/EgtB/PvdO family nonheme iron enzyme [Treponema sp.]